MYFNKKIRKKPFVLKLKRVSHIKKGDMAYIISGSHKNKILKVLHIINKPKRNFVVLEGCKWKVDASNVTKNRNQKE